MRISVMGAGYVGLVTAAGFAKLGHEVVCIDTNPEVTDKINHKQPHYYEEGLKELLERYVPTNLSATTDFEQAILNSEVTFICVGTPPRKEGKMYEEQIIAASEAIGQVLKEKDSWHLVVVKSTVVPGTTEDIVIKKIQEISGKSFPTDFGACMNPEFLREGRALRDFNEPDRIVIGSTDEKSIQSLKKLYSAFSCPILTATFKEAEMIKYSSNTFLATKISLINEIGNICKRLGIDTNTVAKGVGLDNRIGSQFMRSGIGFGGSCFPKDVQAVAYKAVEAGYHPKLLNAVLEVNEKQPLKLLDLIEDNLRENEEIAILGLTFKENTDDIRQSPALKVIKELVSENHLNLHIFDPMAMEKVKALYPNLDYTSTAQEAVDKAKIVLILTEWQEFKNLNYGDKMVIDGKNLFEGVNLPKNYQGVCW